MNANLNSESVFSAPATGMCYGSSYIGVGFPRNNSSNNRPINSKCGSERLRGGEFGVQHANSDNIVGREKRGGILGPDSGYSVFLSIIPILFRCSPSKIGKMVIKMIVVIVKAEHSLRTRTNERLKNNGVKSLVVPLVVLDEHNVLSATVASARFNDDGGISNEARPSPPSGAERANTAKRTCFVSWRIGNWFPGFLFHITPLCMCDSQV